MGSVLEPLGELQATRYSLDDRGVARITLSRPLAGNSRNQQMRDELIAICDAAARDAKVKVVILRGEGDRYFCSGMDLKEASRDETSLERRERLRRSRDIEQLAQLPQPTLAAINGYALGGGLEMALACDLRLMASEAQIGMPEVGHGLMPGGGATQRLPRLIGYARAAEMLFLGDRVDAATALQLGLVNRAVPLTDLDASTDELASRIAQQPTAALRATKEALVAGIDLSMAEGVKRELDGLLFLMADRRPA